MKILKLQLRGSKGIKKGLGVEEIAIDFTQFGPGLIALTGRNGSGKSTILENLHPYRRMVSREGSLQSHFFLKDSYRILEFEQDGNIYTSKILIDALTGGSEAYLLKNYSPLNDGKVSTYDIAIEELLGSEQLFFNSVFSGQKSKGIADLKPADRRKLFYELLNLTQYDGYLEHSKAELKRSELELAKVEGELNSLMNTVSESVDSLNLKQEKEIQKRDDLLNIIAETEEDIDCYKKDIILFESDVKKLEEADKENIRILNEISKLGQDKTLRKIAYERKLESLEFDKAQLYLDIDSKKNIAANRSIIEAKIKHRNELATLISDINVKVNEYHIDLGTIRDCKIEHQKTISAEEKEIFNAQQELKQYEFNLEDAVTALERVKNDVAIIRQVPCNEEIGKRCQFLINAFTKNNDLFLYEGKVETAQKLVDDCKAALQNKKKSFEVKKAQLSSADEEAFKFVKSKLSAAEEELKKHNKAYTELDRQNIDKLAKDATNAESEIKVLTEKIKSIEQQILSLNEQLNIDLQKYDNDIENLRSKIDNSVREKYDDINHQLCGRKYDLEQKQKSLPGLKEELSNSIGTISAIAALIHKTIEDQKKAEKLLADKAIIEAEIKDWTFLCKAFDKTGIPVLKLENSGIEITSIANELLSLFDNKFRIVFETTSLTKDKKKVKETFDINIVEEDGVCEIGNKSGGQQVYLETAIRLAISAVVKMQGKNIQTSFLDEADGALDMENAYHYMEMIEMASKRSGVYNTFVITHRPELLDYIPQQVKLADGYLQIINN